MPRRGLTLLELVVVLTILVALATLIVPTMGFLGSKSQAVSTQENLQRLQELLVNRYIPDMGGSTYVPPVGVTAPNPYAASGTNIGNMVANLPAPGAVGYAARNTFHPQLRYLYVNPDSNPETMTWTSGATVLSVRRWQGPYVEHTGGTYAVSSGTATNNFTTEYGQDGDPTVLDAWARPIVIQVPTQPDPTTGEPGVNFARLVSAGPNGVIDTSEDVTMPTLDYSATGRGDDVIMFLFHNDLYGKGVPTLGQ